MCTDEQWTPRKATNTIMISEFWKKVKNASQVRSAAYTSFWLTPLDVPPAETTWLFQFPAKSEVCQTHTPCKLR